MVTMRNSHHAANRSEGGAVYRTNLACAVAFSLSFACGPSAWAQPWKEMDYGPFLTASIEVDRGNMAYKAIAIRLDDGPGGVAAGDAFVAFDTDTLRCAAGWMGPGLIDWRNVVYDGSHTTHPSVVGKRMFVNPVGPGWADPVSGKFLDRRIRGVDGRAYGPLERAWGHWQGLFRHGNRVILSYTVGDVPILESPSLETHGGQRWIARTLWLGPRSGDLVMQVAGDATRMARVLEVADPAGGPHQVALLESAAEAESARGAGAAEGYALEGDRHFDVSGSADFRMAREDFSIVARLRTRQGGTILARAPAEGNWARDGETFFVRGGRLCFDIGWVGDVESRRKINDGKWHTVAVTNEGATGTLRLYVDGRLQGERRMRPESVIRNHVLRIGYTSPNFPRGQSAFVGQMRWVRFYARQLSGRELSGESVGDQANLVAAWDLSRLSDGKLPDDSHHGHSATLAAHEAMVGKAEVTAVLLVGTTGAGWLPAEKGLLRLHIPAGDDPLQLKLIYAGLDASSISPTVWHDAAQSPPPDDLRTLTRGAAPIWPTALRTKIGTLGPSGGSFEVQALTLPRDNPWHSWIRLGGLDFFADGDRMAVCSWQGDVWMVSGLRGRSGELQWRRIASGLFQPLGLKIVDDQIYVLGRDQITRLHDLNADGETDFYENFNNDAQVTDHFHEFAMDLQTDREGNFIYSKGARHALPAVVPQHGTLIKVSPDGRHSEIIARGFRAPDGVLVNDDGTYFVSDQEGHWTPMNRINWVRPGGFYGNMMAFNPRKLAPDETDPPVCWIHKELDRSPTAQVWVRSEQWGPLNGALLSLSYGTSKTWRVLYERVGDIMQGGIVQLPIPEFPTGIQRGRFHPGDGMLYLCGLFGWSSDKTKPGGLYRVRYTGRPVRVPDELRVTRLGVLLHFPFPVDPVSAADPRSYVLSRWNYRRTANYGSDDYRVSDGKPGRDPVRVAGISISNDAHSIFLHVPEMRTCMQMRIRYGLKSLDGQSASGLIDHTVHVLPEPAAELRSRFANHLDAASLTHSERPENMRDREIETRPGLILRTARTGAPGQGDARVTRLAALRAAGDHSPSLFLPPGPFTAEWDGFIRMELSEEVTIRAEFTGRLAVQINGREILSGSAARPETRSSGPLVLKTGNNRLQVHLESAPEGEASLRLLWLRDSRVWEPLRPSALVHAAAEDLALADQLRLGRELLAVRNCRRCHRLSPAADAPNAMPELARDTPNLSGVADRFESSWLQNWILKPRSVRNKLTMPRIFEENGANRQEVADIVAYLMTLRDKNALRAPVSNKGSDEDTEESVEAGLELYEDLGCLACHHFEPPGEEDPYDRISLRFVGAKYRPGALVAFLRQPHKDYAWRRMPDFQLSDREAQSLAAYVRRQSTALDAPDVPPGDAARGKTAFEDRGCRACHAVDRPATLPTAAQRPLFGRPLRVRGCLADSPEARDNAPWFDFNESERAALIAFLRTDGSTLGQYVPAEAAARTIRRLRCTLCHRRDGRLADWPEILMDEGERGLPPELVPPLTWTGEKLYPDWIERRLKGELDYRPRPWMRARMPLLPAHARVLARGLAAQHGMGPQRESAAERNAELVSRGKQLVGPDKGFNCLQCHGLPGRPPEASFESRGLDFVHVPDRIRASWFRRWLGNPPQFDVSVKMPRFSPDGKTTAVLGPDAGDAAKQFAAIWAYLNSLPGQRQ